MQNPIDLGRSTGELGRTLRRPSSNSKKPRPRPPMNRNLFEGTPAQPAVVGTRLTSFRLVWAELIKDPWTVSTIWVGHRWSFKNRPPRVHFCATKLPPSKEKRLSLVQYIQDLLRKQAIVDITPSQRGQGFYSPLFLVRKKSGDFRPVLKPKETQPVNSGRNIQDGEPSINSPGDKSGRVDALDRSSRRILTYPDSRRVPEIPQIYDKQLALPILKSSVWNLQRTQDVHESPIARDSPLEREGIESPPLPGRHPASLGQQGVFHPASGNPGLHLTVSRVADKLGEKQYPSHSENGLFRGRAGHEREHGGASRGEDSSPDSEGEEGYLGQEATSQNMPQYPGLFGIHHSDGSVGAVELEAFPDFLPAPVERGFNVPVDSHPSGGEAIIAVVDSASQLKKVQEHYHPSPGDGDFRCQSAGVGSSPSALCGSRPLAIQGTGHSVKCC